MRTVAQCLSACGLLRVTVCVALRVVTRKTKKLFTFQQSNQQKAMANSRASRQWNWQKRTYVCYRYAVTHTHIYNICIYMLVRMKAYLSFQSQTLSRCMQHIFIN